MLPEFPLLDVGQAEFPVLFGLVDAREKALALLLLRKVEEEFDDARPVGVKMFLQIRDRTITVVPDPCRGAARPGSPSLREFRDARERSGLPRNRIG